MTLKTWTSLALTSSTTRIQTVNQTSRKFCVYHSSNNYIANLSVSWQRYWLRTIMDKKKSVISTYSSTSLSPGMLVLRDTSSSLVCQYQNIEQMKLWRREVIKKNRIKLRSTSNNSTAIFSFRSEQQWLLYTLRSVRSKAAYYFYIACEVHSV